MELTLNVGDNINIPENCEVVVKDNTLTIKEKQEEPFKDGDILYSRVTMRVFICKIYPENYLGTYYSSDFISNLRTTPYFRHATEEEKQKLFAELRAKGLKWNAETKTFEKFRVRAKDREKYLTINEFGEVIELDEDNCLYDDKKYNLGNYYILEERKQAEQDAKAVRAIYEKRTKI